MELNVLAVGDVVSQAGLDFLRRSLPRLKRERGVHFTVVNGENAAGIGLFPNQAEDILDSGLTLKYLKDLLLQRHASNIRIATLLDKPARREQEIYADYVGYTIPDAFVVGYGLDYAERYRNLPYLGILKPEVYS